MEQFFALALYFTLISAVVFWSAGKVKSSSDFILGSRSMNYWLTALSAHASDMGHWLFMGYPAAVFLNGLYNVWVVFGLLVCMWLNWTFIASKIRKQTGFWNCSTFSTFLHRRFKDESGLLQILSAAFCFLFFVVYICAGLIGLGMLGQTLFGINYVTGIILGSCIVIVYVAVGGYITLAWLDLIQGLFLMAVICAAPFYISEQLGGWTETLNAIGSDPASLKILPHSASDVFLLLSMFFGWGLGYFGQPHIVTKFMGIGNPEEIKKSRAVGMTWMALSLAAATFIGLLGIQFFKEGIQDPQLIFVEMAKQSFSPFIASLVLCAVLAAIINQMSSQLLVLSSILTEDVYKLWFKNATSKQLLKVSRLSVITAGLIAFAIAYAQVNTIYELVHYAWSGLGASFGPLVIVALYSKKANRNGAIAGLITGGLTAAVWPFVGENVIGLNVDAMIPGFLFSFLAIFTVSRLTEEKVTAGTGIADARDPQGEAAV